MSVVIREVTHRFPRADRDLFTDISLEVQRGESVALMGPSGSGKTTLLSIIGLLIAPTRGSVRYNGGPRTVADSSAMWGKGISWVLQTVNLLPRRTVLDNVVLPAVAHGRDRRAAELEAQRLLELLALPSLASSPARRVSGGAAQRVAIARALISHPIALLADEPTASLDRGNATIVMERLLHAAQDTTLIVATHDPVVAGLASRVVQLDQLVNEGQCSS